MDIAAQPQQPHHAVVVSKTLGSVPLQEQVSQASSSSADASITITNGGPRSVYDFHNKRRQYLILLAAAIASILVPFTDTICKSLVVTGSAGVGYFMTAATDAVTNLLH